MKKYLLLAILLIALVVWARLSFYTVDAAEYVYVTVLGQPVATYDGADDQGAGLKFGWPWPVSQVMRLDRRLQQFDLPAVEQLTHDPEGKTIDKILVVEAYVCWKIADDKAVDRFVRRIGSAARARSILEPRINGELGKEIGKISMDDLVTDRDGGEVADQTTTQLRANLLASLKPQLLQEYGIDLIDIRLRRFNHPAAVRDSIFQRIRSERNKKVTEYDSDAAFQAAKILSETEQKNRQKMAEARIAEEKIKADADTTAMKIRNEAYSQDPEFYAFLKKMEKMQSIVGDGKTMLLLSTNRDLFESLFQPPRSKAGPQEKSLPKGNKGNTKEGQ